MNVQETACPPESVNSALRAANALQQLAINILGCLNDDSPFPETIENVVSAIQESTGIEAVAIRLRNGDDFNYLAARGFAERFLIAENSLTAHASAGDICRDESGMPLLECTCGLVLSGQSRQLSEVFTASGSCFLNHGRRSLVFTDSTKDPRIAPRGRCFSENYQSVALVPVRAHQEIVGLLQLCDKRPNCFTRELIEFFEGLSASIGLALARKQAQEELNAKSAKLNLALTSVGMGAWSWEVAEDKRAFDRQTCALLGIDEKTFTGTAEEFFAIVHPDDRKAIISSLASTLAGSGMYEIEYRAIWPDGGIHNIAGRGNCIRDPQGRPIRIEGVIWDITERRLAEEALRRNEALQRAIITNISDVVAIVDEKGINRFKSSNIEKWFGWQPEEVVGRPAAEHLHPDDQPAIQAQFAQLLAQPGSTISLECRYLCKDGEYKWIEIAAVNLLNNPDIGGVLLNYHDISQRKLINDHLRLLQATLDLAPDGVYWIDAHGKIIFANAAACNRLGYSIDEFANMHIWSINPLVQEAQWLALWQEVKGGRRVTVESVSHRKDGSTLPVEIGSTYVAFGSNEYVCCFARDINERQRAQAALRESEERYRVLFQSSRDALMTLAPPSWQFSDCNAAAVSLFRACDIADLKSRAPWQLSPERQPDGQDSAEKARVMIETAMQQGTRSFEWVHRNTLGEEFPASVVLTRVELNGTQMLQATVRDESERKRMLARMGQSDRLASMGMLAAGVAHEINNPLAYVRYNIESLAEDLPQLTSAIRQTCPIVEERLGKGERHRLLGADAHLLEEATLNDIVARGNEALEGLQRIVAITRSLSTFSRVEQSNCTKVNVAIALEAAIDMAHNEVAHRARLSKVFDPLPSVWASEGKLSHAFLNLLINAAQAIDEGHVARNTISIHARSEGQQVVVEISDTGKGIAPEDLERIFEPFYTTKQLGEGSGLGLSISRSILEELRGTLSVSSKVGVGSRFSVRLPAIEEVPASADSPCPATSAEALGTTGRILLIDDEANIARSLTRLLGRGYTIVAVSSGKEAQDLVTVDPQFDLILCDLMMSQMSGIEFHAWLADYNSGLASRLIFITGGVFTPNAREYLGKVTNLTIEKPFDAPQLRRQVAEKIGASRQQN